jgi:hypothetical protein
MGVQRHGKYEAQFIGSESVNIQNHLPRTKWPSFVMTFDEETSTLSEFPKWSVILTKNYSPADETIIMFSLER